MQQNIVDSSIMQGLSSLVKGIISGKSLNVPLYLCISSCDAEKLPTSVKDRTALLNAWTQDAVITFNSDGDSSHFHDKLLLTFPQLANSGYDESAFCPLKSPDVPRRVKDGGWAVQDI
ncbi:Hypothetical predicted protein [Paramuricea clavata]|uniref:Uncharacterized protein n=1 Tax=Paramuricea clavata TaxID=317549 RepID=A0A6S7GKJ6_PARCT|nr:Hypothetical predicted protein [Paramuricea clavata]